MSTDAYRLLTPAEKIETNLSVWGKSFKKSALTFWVLYVLREKHLMHKEILEEVQKVTSGLITCKEFSLYRLLWKLEQLELVKWGMEGPFGEQRSCYYSTLLGKNFLCMLIHLDLSIFAPIIYNACIPKPRESNIEGARPRNVAQD